ncbi:MAG: ribosome silencing factor [Flaviflexus sp.]|uniref:ribosome silencing factor n=1 Tax=Flaviflexus sp. TaxID=1969482 RepID=UPI00352DE2FF
MTATPTSITHARVAAEAAFDKLATSVVVIDVSERLPFTDLFVIASGETSRQVRAIMDAIDEELNKAGVDRLRREGLDGEARWVLADYGDIIVHVQHDEEREFYALERLWADCPQIDVSDLEGQR